MELSYNPKYPTVDDLRAKAKKRMPGFAFDYLDGGCNEEINLQRNTEEIREVQLRPYYLREHQEAALKTTLFGHAYDAPFGVAPIGLQGLMWPNSAEILARAAFKHNIPYILSTVTTSSIERISELTEGRAWFQLYHPTEDKLRDDIINRAAAAQCPVLVILCDVPTFGYRPRDIRNGLAMPPKMGFKNILQILSNPTWALQTLYYGRPKFATMLPYIPKNLDMGQLGKLMDQTFSGKLNEEKIKPLRDMWKGKLVLKGVASEEDAETAFKLGLDGIIVSNHGGRQLDAGESTISSLRSIVEKYKSKFTVMMDSGINSGPDIARTLATGAEFAFLGRAFMYGVGALGEAGGHHTISMLKIQLKQVMDQIGCETVQDLPDHLI